MPPTPSPKPAGNVWRSAVVALLVCGGMVGSYYLGRSSGNSPQTTPQAVAVDAKTSPQPKPTSLPSDSDGRPRLGTLASGTPDLAAVDSNAGFSEIDLAEIEKSILELGRTDVDGALLELAQQSPSIRAGLAPNILKFLAAKFPAKCADWAIQNLAGQKLVAGIKPVIDVWVEADPKSALDWLFTKGETTNDILGEHFAAKLGAFWKGRAEEFLMSRPQSEKRDQLANAVAQSWGGGGAERGHRLVHQKSGCLAPGSSGRASGMGIHELYRC